MNIITNPLYLPDKITSSKDLESQFRKAFGSDTAKDAKKVIYFFVSEKPVSRVKGESRILYIGKTEDSLSKRYYRHAATLAAGGNGLFYEYIIKNYGSISFAYLFSDNPKQDEEKYFKQYFDEYFEYPPKSKVG